MAIRISPSTVKPEEFGYIQGNVKSVSFYPVTRDEMMFYLLNEVWLIACCKAARRFL